MAQTNAKQLPLRTMRLRRVELVSFRISEASHLGMLQAMGLKLVRADEVVMLVSRSGDQILFVYRPKKLARNGRMVRVIHSERLRLEGGTWSPALLRQYAAQIGIKLVGGLVDEYAGAFDERKFKDMFEDACATLGKTTEQLTEEILAPLRSKNR